MVGKIPKSFMLLFFLSRMETGTGKTDGKTKPILRDIENGTYRSGTHRLRSKNGNSRRNKIHVTTQRNIVLTANKERILEPPWSRLLLRTALHISSQHMHMHTENQKFRTAKPRHTHATCIRHIDTAVHHTGTGPIAHVHPSPYSPFQVVEMRPWRSGRSSMRWNWTEQLVAECRSLGSMGPGGLGVVAVGSRWAAECRVDGRGPGHLGRRGGGGV